MLAPPPAQLCAIPSKHWASCASNTTCFKPLAVDSEWPPSTSGGVVQLGRASFGPLRGVSRVASTPTPPHLGYDNERGFRAVLEAAETAPSSQGMLHCRGGQGGRGTCQRLKDYLHLIQTPLLSHTLLGFNISCANAAAVVVECRSWHNPAACTRSPPPHTYTTLILQLRTSHARLQLGCMHVRSHCQVEYRSYIPQ